MSPLVITLIIVAVALVILGVLYIVGNKLQKKQMAQREEMKAAAQQASMLVIDKKIMKMKDAGLPKQVMEQTPKRFRGAKIPVVKVKVGPQIMNLICDEAIFDDVPTKGEMKAMVSGIYITEVKSVRGKKKKNAEEAPRKKSWGEKMRKKQSELQAEFAKDEKEKEARKALKAQEKAKKDKAKKITQ